MATDLMSRARRKILLGLIPVAAFLGFVWGSQMYRLFTWLIPFSP